MPKLFDIDSFWWSRIKPFFQRRFRNQHVYPRYYIIMVFYNGTCEKNKSSALTQSPFQAGQSVGLHLSLNHLGKSPVYLHKCCEHYLIKQIQNVAFSHKHTPLTRYWLPDCSMSLMGDRTNRRECDKQLLRMVKQSITEPFKMCNFHNDYIYDGHLVQVADLCRPS